MSGATPICTNGIAIGTIIAGSWLNPTFAASTTQVLYTLSISPGTWILKGSIYLFSGGSGRFITWLKINGTAYTQDEIWSPGTGASITCQSTAFTSVSSTTTCTFEAMAICGGTNSWSSDSKGFFAVKIA